MGSRKKAATAADEGSRARDFCMARLAACRASITQASEALDEALALFVVPPDDEDDDARPDLLEDIDDALGAAAMAVQAAQARWPDVDPDQGEDDDEEEEDEEEDEEPEPAKPRKRRAS
jgi:hypothetical protein